MNQRETILQDAFLNGKSLKLSETCTLRRIGLQEDYVIRAARFASIDVEFLTQIVNFAKNSLSDDPVPPELEEKLSRIAFVCSRSREELSAIRLAARRGDFDGIEEQYFDWLGTMTRDEMFQAKAWVAADLLIIAAAHFKPEPSGADESKNAPIPATSQA